MPSTYLREKMAAVIAEATHVSLHIADPGAAGASEVTGGTYVRVGITSWAPGAVDGTYTATLAGDFNVPANTEITWAGLWNGTQFLDKTPTSATTIGADVVQILSLTFVVPDPDAA